MDVLHIDQGSELKLFCLDCIISVEDAILKSQFGGDILGISLLNVDSLSLDQIFHLNILL